MRIRVLFLFLLSTVCRAERIPVLILDGMNNHDWRATTEALHATLDAAGLFEVSVATAPEIKFHRTMPREPKDADEASLAAYQEAKTVYDKAKRAAESRAADVWKNWLPEFDRYRAVIMNYSGRSWPEPMQAAFLDYMKNGGGLVLIHAANNAFGNWPEFNEIIGLGYNGARGGATQCTKVDPATNQPFLCCPGVNSGHGSRHAYKVTVRNPLHPIMRDIPPEWKHGVDELYHNLRGPAKQMQILSSAYSDPKTRGTGEHEPLTYVTRYGQGRCVVTTMGHFWPRQTDWDSLYCVGFQTVFARSVEFVATGRVSLDLPAEFPGPDAVSIVPPHQLSWTANGAPTRPEVAERTAWRKKKEANKLCLLRPEEAAEAMVLPDEFVIEAVASEPMVQEPVLAVWDGNGAMYVAEMRSYMQNASGDGTKTLKNGRVKRLVDEDGDGIMDRATVFVDGLNLPRMILPLDDRIAVVETDHTAVWSYRDADGDGVADEKKLLFEGRPGSPKTSVEHQNSGLIWNLDNWIYTSYGHERFRFTTGTLEKESMVHHWAQWGLDRDDEGRIYYSANSEPAKSIQVHRVYWDHIRRAAGGNPRFTPTLGTPYAPEFLEAKRIATRADRGGAITTPRTRFTSVCGQSVYRGDRFPQAFRGNYFVCDPTIHVVRRALIENVNGKRMLSNPYGEEEFLLSSDFNFRPVNTATGPDGCLYVVDMYRGIIQDAPWYDANARNFANQTGIAKHIQNGRIWRIRHRDHRPAPHPRMLDESTMALIRHFESANGWRRDTAQKLILLREDRESVAPILQGIVRFDPHNPLVRLHALWTLEGMGRAKPVLEYALNDRDPRLRVAALRVGESLIKAGDEDILSRLESLASDRDPEVAKQLILSLGYSDTPQAMRLVEQAVRAHIGHDGVYLAALTVFWKKDSPFIQGLRDGSVFKELGRPATDGQRWLEGLSLADHRSTPMPKEWTPRQKWLTGNGETLYFNNCRACHGVNGEGQTIPGTELRLAPPLVNSPRVTGDPEDLLRILFNGLHGPVDGKTYAAGIMVPVANFGITDINRVAQVANYLRFAWGHGQDPLEIDAVKQAKESVKNRTTPWTLEELAK